MFGSVSQHFANVQHKNSWKSCVSRLKALFRVPNLRKKFCHEHIECNLFDPKWWLGVFRCISQTFDTKIHTKVVSRGWKHYFGIPNFWKKLCHERIQSNLFDPKWCLGVFRSISQTFDTKIHTKVVSRGWKHYFGIPNFWKNFCHERIQSNLFDTKWCLGVFRSISQTFDTKIHEKVVFRALMHYSVVPNFWKKFCNERIQSNLLDQKRCLGVFWSISQIFSKENHAKLVFQGWRYYFGVPSFRKKFCHERIQSNPIDPKWFGSVSEHFANLRHEKSWKTCISSMKGLFRGTELSEKVLPRTHPI